jgi:hypothetical protein
MTNKEIDKEIKKKIESKFTIFDMEEKPHNYEMLPFQAQYNMELKLELLDLIGDPYESMILSLVSDPSKAGTGFHKIISSLYKKDPKLTFIYKLLAQTLRDGILVTRDNFNTIYTDNLEELYEVLIKAIRRYVTGFLPWKTFGNLFAEGSSQIENSEN